MTEDQLQQQIFTWYNNNYCLKTQENRGMVFSVPNGGSRNVVEAKKMKATGLLPGVSDLIVVLPTGKLLFIELKTETGIQSQAQKDFEERITKLGQEYYLIRSLEQFKALITQNKTLIT